MAGMTFPYERYLKLAEEALTEAGIESPYFVEAIISPTMRPGIDDPIICRVSAYGNNPSREVKLSHLSCSEEALKIRCGLPYHLWPYGDLRGWDTFAPKYRREREALRNKTPATISLTQYDEMMNRIKRIEEKMGANVSLFGYPEKRK
jgi:hypothetical protein